MTTYTFETIGAAEALNFNSSLGDSLVFSAPGSTASNISVAFDQTPYGTSATSETVVTSGVTGRTVVFGPYFGGANLTISFMDGSKALVGSLDNAASLIGHDEPDAIFAGFRTLALTGGGGDDTLVGGFVTENFTGGAGNDLFIINPRYSSGYHLSDSREMIQDWQPGDHLSFGPMTVTEADIYRTTSDSPGGALEAANTAIAAGNASVVAVGFGTYTLIFADSHHDHGEADNVVWLLNTTPSAIHASDFVATPAQPTFAAPVVDEPALPLPPAFTATVHATFNGVMDVAHIGDLLGAAIDTATSTQLSLNGVNADAALTGTGLVYDGNEQLIGGTINQASFYAVSGAQYFNLRVDGLAASAAPFGQWVAQNATDAAFSSLLPGNDALSGGATADLIRVQHGNHLISGGGGADSLFGGDGDDQIFAHDINVSGVSTFLRGGGGNDYISGGSGFDNINANTGNDTVDAGSGGDWALGGQGDDMVFGGAGNDIINGNMGQDTCVGGDGADTVRGGQGDDFLHAGTGDDWLFGDLGSNTLTGGAGTDTFFAGAGRDVVTDFNGAEGDRVLVGAGVTWHASPSADGVIVDFSNGGQMVLQGATLQSLPSNWIIQA